jgi:hypothetical protein
MCVDLSIEMRFSKVITEKQHISLKQGVCLIPMPALTFVSFFIPCIFLIWQKTWTMIFLGFAKDIVKMSSMISQRILTSIYCYSVFFIIQVWWLLVYGWLDNFSTLNYISTPQSLVNFLHWWWIYFMPNNAYLNIRYCCGPLRYYRSRHVADEYIIYLNVPKSKVKVLRTWIPEDHACLID